MCIRSIFTLSLCLLLCLQGTAQSYSSQEELITVVQQRTVYLNSGSRAAFEGTSRIAIPIPLPTGTKQWYYTFSTSAGESGTQNLNFLAQLTTMALAPSGITEATISQLQIPPGSASIDVYLLDRANSKAFLDKDDFSYYRDVSVANTKDAVVPVTVLESGLYLGLRNPDLLDGVNVTIEVVAVVASDIYEDKWTAENIDMLYDNCQNNFVLAGDVADGICDCYKSKVQKAYKPSVYTALAESELNSIEKKTIKDCAKALRADAFLVKEQQAEEAIELYQGQSVTKDYAGMEQSLQKLISLGMKDDQIYNGLGFCQLCLKKTEEAKKNLTMGLGKNPTDLLLLGNLANYYLLTNQYDLAIAILKEHKNKKLDDDRKFKEAVADDLKEFERLGIKLSDFNKVRSELNIR